MMAASEEIITGVGNLAQIMHPLTPKVRHMMQKPLLNCPFSGRAF